MQGDKVGGFSVFWADDGLDTGPILLQKKTFVDPNDTVDSLYNRFLFPEGVKAMVCLMLSNRGNILAVIVLKFFFFFFYFFFFLFFFFFRK